MSKFQAANEESEENPFTSFYGQLLHQGMISKQITHLAFTLYR
jgi:hypothetical protein